ncbi:SRPBCC family protein [Ruania suaedae]|uniref:SRPBCC family protein n=1 Tax=Ruania suaedae TaxID=2897774 RepID=UPI001E28764B|nr:SRPBCC family protein [Ruania suaedae]UFU03005.1 SRPBCC family protein [Ruania suaedae]
MRRTIAVTGDASPEEVWSRYVHPGRWPEWAGHIRSVTCDDEILRVGSRGAVHGPLGLRADFTVTEVDSAAWEWAWRVRCGPIRLRLAHGVQPGCGGNAGSRTWLTIDGAAPVVLGYALPAAWALRRLVALR